MNSRPLLPRLLTWLLTGGLLTGAIWLGSSLIHSPTRKHSLAARESIAVDPARPADATLGRVQPRVAARENSAPENGVVPAGPSITNDEFLNQHYPNQIIAEVKPAEVKASDTPAQFEQKVRAMDPEYAKLLDQNAAAERRTALQNAAAQQGPQPRPGTDDER